MHAVGIDELAEITFLIEKADADHRDIKVAGRLQEVARKNAQAAGIERQGGAEAEFHAEICDAPDLRRTFGAAKPAGRLQIALARRDKCVEFFLKFAVLSECLQTFGCQALQNGPRIISALPKRFVDIRP